MSTYENAPATHLLNTYCAYCGRPLLDAISVEMGIGPECRKKVGLTNMDGHPNRPAANKVIYAISANRNDSEFVKAQLQALRDLEFGQVADVLEDRLFPVDITITEEGDRLVVKTPYNMEAVYAFAKIPGRKWLKLSASNSFPRNAKPAVWIVLQQFYAGSTAKGPKGRFTVPAIKN
jgi:hypothetical protein